MQSASGLPPGALHLDRHRGTPVIQGTPIKSKPLGKIDISGIVLNFVAKFTVFIED